MNAYPWMGVLTGIVEKHPIPVFAMKDTEESYATNQFASEFEKSYVSSVPINWRIYCLADLWLRDVPSPWLGGGTESWFFPVYCLFCLKKSAESWNPDWKNKSWYFCLIHIIVLHYGCFGDLLTKILILKNSRLQMLIKVFAKLWKLTDFSLNFTSKCFLSYFTHAYSIDTFQNFGGFFACNGISG